MPALVDISANAHISWAEIRAGIDACVALAAPNARRHKEWVLEFDPITGLGKIITLLRKLDAEGNGGNVHAWVVGVGSMTLQRGQNGDFEYIGGKAYDYWLNFDIWGFWNYGGLESGSWEIAEAETRLVVATIYRNPTLGLENQWLRRAEPPDFAQLDIVPFSEGENLIVAQGQMRVLVGENLSV